ncbi:hypothetical protein L6164_026226 [Bauhinia variegata]|uniref:Uncharacterized protein n=1 Tax=Bauhinia variegata TaxID=167791 RepID=A0ACB9LQ33_BAUVA|nr:hypothetical protein L6164_026226 [Bauhinia variegata]
MALRSLSLTHQNRGKLFRALNPCAFSSLLFPSLPYSTTDSHESNSYNSRIVDTLISIFTREPFTPNDPETMHLSPRITSQVVESVLKGLKSWKIAQTFFIWASNQNGYKHSCYTFNAMGSILSRAQQSALLRDMLKYVLHSRCSFTPGALGFLIRCLGNVGLIEEANEFFDEVRLMGLCVPNNYSYNCLLEVLSKSSSIDLLEMRLKEMRDMGWQFDKYTLTSILHAYCNSGKFEEALNVYNKIHGMGWADAHICSVLVCSVSKRAMVDKAFELVERMEEQDITLNEKTFCILIHGFVKESRVDKALQMFDKMLQAGFTPDVSLYDVLIGGLCRNQELDKAFNLCLEMIKFGVQPDAEILTKILSTSLDRSRIIQLLEEIPEDIKENSRVLLYNAILNSYVCDGLIDEAYHFLQVMMGRSSTTDMQIDTFYSVKKMVFPNTNSFGIVIDGLLKNARLDLALGLLNDMQQNFCKPNIVIYNNLIKELCNSGRLEEGFDLLRKMKESGLQPTEFTHNSIYGCLCQRKDILGAINMLREMRTCGHEPWIKYSTLLVKGLSGCGRVVEACDFLSIMVQEGFLPDIISYSAAISGLIKIQEVDRALHLFRDFCSHGYYPDVVAFNILVDGLCKENRLIEAENLLNEIVMRGLSPSVVTYNCLIDGWCKNGSIDKARLLLYRMFEEGRQPNIITYVTLVDGLCRAGNPDDALLIWNEMERKGCAPNRIAFMALIHGLCKCCRPTDALHFLREMECKEMKADSYIYAALLSAFISDLNLPSAFEILKEMIDKGSFPESHDKNFSNTRDAIIKLSKNDMTSSGIQALIKEGNIPASFLSTS